MIGKGKSITHTQAAVNYAVVKEKAEIIGKQHVTGDTGEKIAKEFKTFQDLNGRCKNNTLSFVLSPSPEDGKKLTSADFLGIGREFLQKHGLENHQAVILKHTDKEHTHLHIYANRISMEGKALKDHHIGKISQRIAKEIARDRGLTVARDVEEDRKQEVTPIKEEVQHRFENAIKTARPTNLNEFWDALRANKIEVKPTINKAGKMQGYRVEFSGQSFKASEIGNKYTIAKIDKTLQAEQQQTPQKTNRNRGMRR